MITCYIVLSIQDALGVRIGNTSLQQGYHLLFTINVKQIIRGYLC
jgi:hypothetical protein